MIEGAPASGASGIGDAVEANLSHASVHVLLPERVVLISTTSLIHQHRYHNSPPSHPTLVPMQSSCLCAPISRLSYVSCPDSRFPNILSTVHRQSRVRATDNTMHCCH